MEPIQNLYIAKSTPLPWANPPCGCCRHWNPKLQTLSDGTITAIMCTNPKPISHEFTCFEPRQAS